MSNLEKKILLFTEYWGGYWYGECPEAPLADWKREVLDDKTREDYWTWAYRKAKALAKEREYEKRKVLSDRSVL